MALPTFEVSMRTIEALVNERTFEFSNVCPTTKQFGLLTLKTSIVWSSTGSGTCPELLSHSSSGHMYHQHIIARRWACQLQDHLPQITQCMCIIMLATMREIGNPMATPSGWYNGTFLNKGKKTQRTFSLLSVLSLSCVFSLVLLFDGG